MTTRTIDSGISVKHASTWTVSEAMREVIQNWLDVRNEFKCEGKLDYNEQLGHAFIHDKGPGLKVEHLAFGNNDKSSDSIGQFGEGLKSAFVTLLRNNRSVDIRSNGLSIRPNIQLSEAFGVDTLHYEITEVKTLSTGTNIRIACTLEEFNAGKAYFSKLERSFNWVEKDRISLPGGSIYVHGSKIGSLDDALFSYHFSREEAGTFINRDRDAVDMNKVKGLITQVLNRTSSTKVAFRVMKAITAGEQCFEGTLSLYSYSDRVWKTAFNKLFGKKTLLSDDTEHDANAIYHGYKILNNAGWNTKLFLGSFGVETSISVFAKIAAKKIPARTVKLSELSKEEQSNLAWAKRMVKKYYFEPGSVTVSKDLNSFAGNVDGTVRGCFNRKTNRTYIFQEALGSRKEALEVILHETVHKVSGTSDITAEFEQALLLVSTGIIESLEK